MNIFDFTDSKREVPMYGMINDAIKSMVVDALGANAWDEIQKRAEAPPDFEKMGQYDDSLTYRLVGAVSEVSGEKAEVLLESFGHYWIQYASKTAYGPMIRMFGGNLKDCIRNLDQMHHKMGSMMHGMQPPQFSSTETTPGELLVVYRSTRSGLSPMVKGLIEGLGAYYGEKISVTRKPLATEHLPTDGFKEESHFVVQFLT
jgi:hypothetical protein